MPAQEALESGALGCTSSTPGPRPGPAPLSTPPLPSLAEPGFPLLAVHSQVAWGLQAGGGDWTS